MAKFKSVTDSTPFNSDSAVTALVGKNESGKTALLEAMYRAKPITSGYPTGFEEPTRPFGYAIFHWSVIHGARCHCS